jgi:tetratricopeptide (TPR) repeat protein
MTAIRRDGQNLNFAVPTSELQQFLNKPYSPRPVWEGRSIQAEERQAFAKLSPDTRSKSTSFDEPNSSRTPESQLQRAYDLCESRRYEEAFRAVDDTQSISSKHCYLRHYLYGKCHIRSAEILKAQAHKSGEIEGGPHEMIIVNGTNMSRHSFRTQNEQQGATEDELRIREHYDLAFSFLLEARRLNICFAPTYSQLCSYYFTGSQWNKGLAAAESLVSLTPKCATAHAWRARFLNGLHRPAEALKEVHLALRLNPENHMAIVLAAEVHFGLHEYEDTIALLNKALSLKAAPPRGCHWNLGLAYERLGKYSQALAEYEEAQALESSEQCAARIAYCRRMLR